MVRKLVIIALFLVAGLAVRAHASDPAHLTASDSTYVNGQSTVTISSTAVTTVAAAIGWREFNIGSPISTSRVWFRCDGSTANITTVGWWIDAGSERRIETDNACSFQVEAGTAPVNLRLWTWQH